MCLLDTHAIIWYLIGSNELSETVKNLMDAKRCFFSFVLLWEIAIKQAKGTLDFEISISQLKTILENE